MLRSCCTQLYIVRAGPRSAATEQLSMLSWSRSGSRRLRATEARARHRRCPKADTHTRRPLLPTAPSSFPPRTYPNALLQVRSATGLTTSSPPYDYNELRPTCPWISRSPSRSASTSSSQQLASSLRPSPSRSVSSHHARLFRATHSSRRVL